MTKHTKIQERLRADIQSAILDVGKIEGTEDIALTNTDVVEALLEVTGLYAAMHSFKGYTPIDLAFKHAMTITEHTERYERLKKNGKLPFNIVPRNKVN